MLLVFIGLEVAVSAPRLSAIGLFGASVNSAEATDVESVTSSRPPLRQVGQSASQSHRLADT